MLSGSLDAFRLADVFQLLKLTEKTGVLHISTDATEGRVEFLRGEIAYAVSDTRRMPLAGRLLRRGLVTDSQLRTVVGAQRGGAPALSHVLLDEGVLDDKTFDLLVSDQIQDAVFELMRLDDGTFTFDARAEDDEETTRSASPSPPTASSRRARGGFTTGPRSRSTWCRRARW